MKPLTTAERDYWRHRVEIVDDGRPTTEPVRFLWHFPRGTLARRMSALEIAAFLLPHMASVLPFFSHNAQVYAEFRALLVRLALWPRQVIDEVVPWVKSIIRTAEDDLVELNLFDRGPVRAGPTYFVLGSP